MGKYSDKNAVITGGGSGLGFAMASQLVAFDATYSTGAESAVDGGATQL